jgi:hypothetical protein
MEKKYYSLGKISYNLLAIDEESLNKIIEWREKVGASAFTFIHPDEKFISQTRKIVEENCKDWAVISNVSYDYEPEQSMVMRNILENKKIKTIHISLQKNIKQITFYITPSQDSWAFVTTFFTYKVPKETYSRPYSGKEYGCWSAFFCDMEFDDSLSSLVKDICEWYEIQDVITYNQKYY